MEAYAAGFKLANEKMDSKKSARRWEDSYEAFREASDMADNENEKRVSAKWGLYVAEMNQKDFQKALKDNYDFDPLEGKKLVFENPEKASKANIAPKTASHKK